MNEEILEIVLESNNFLLSYLKQFRNNLGDNATVTEIGIHSDKYLNYLASLGCNINKQDRYDGVIVINTFLYEQKEESLYKMIDELLVDNGYVFLVIHNKGMLKEHLTYHFLTKYELVQEYIGDENWNFLLYQKSTIK